MPRRAIAPELRFWKRVKKTKTCWLWTGGRVNTYGHGAFSLSHSKPMMAHRFSWTLKYGPIPFGKWILHKCDVARCVRPSHLFLGTPKDNTQDMLRKGRHWVPGGEDNGQAKLTNKEVVTLRRLAKQGVLQRVLAQQFQINQSQVSRIINHHRR